VQSLNCWSLAQLLSTYNFTVITVYHSMCCWV
jgi:hypothetical protein